MDQINTFGLSKVCRACLEPSEKMYPLIGPVANVDVNIIEMISYCICSKIEIGDDLPNGVCVLCFRTIRISYNFLQQFNDSQEKLKSNMSTNKLFCNLVENNVSQEEFYINEGLNIHNDDNNYSEAEILDINNENINDTNSESEQINKCLDKDDLVDNTSINCVNGNIEIINLDEVFESSKDEVNKTQDNNVSHLIYEPNVKTISDSEIVISKTLEDSKPESSNQTIIRQEQLSVYYCPFCEKKCNRIKEFEKHIQSHNKKYIICNKCPKQVKFSIKQYVHHYKENHRYYCLICKKSLLSSYGFRYHKMQHTNVRKYVCKYCPKSFFLYHLLKKHMVIHSDKFKHKCKLCGAQFKSYDTYRYHLVTHDGKRRFLCTLCGKKFYQSVHLRDHIYRHTGYKQFTCDQCGYSFTTKSQLKKHFNHCNGLGKRKRNT